MSDSSDTTNDPRQAIFDFFKNAPADEVVDMLRALAKDNPEFADELQSQLKQVFK